MTVASINFLRKSADGPLWEDAGEYVPLYRPQPMIVLADLPDVVVGDTAHIFSDWTHLSDPITFVRSVDVSIDGGPWAPLPGGLLNLLGGPPVAGGAYQSEFDNDYALTGLDALRGESLGTRRRYVFRATNYAGASAYEELVLEVRLNAAGEHSLHSINLGAPAGADVAANTVPEAMRHRLQILPLIADADEETVTLPLPLWMNDSVPGGGVVAETELSFSRLVDLEFVFMDDTGLDPDFTPEHVFPHFGRNHNGVDTDRVVAEYRPLPGQYAAAVLRDEVRAVSYDLNVFGSDEDTEATDPSRFGSAIRAWAPSRNASS